MSRIVPESCFMQLFFRQCVDHTYTIRLFHRKSLVQWRQELQALVLLVVNMGNASLCEPLKAPTSIDQLHNSPTTLSKTTMAKSFDTLKLGRALCKAAMEYVDRAQENALYKSHLKKLTACLESGMKELVAVWDDVALSGTIPGSAIMIFWRLLRFCDV